MQPANDQPQRSALPPVAVAPNDPDLACRVVNLAWYLVAARLPWRSHVERLHALEAAGLVPNELTFPRMAAGIR